jgi:hypothetical protein
LEALATRDDQDAGPARLSIYRWLPFDEEYFVLSLDQLNLEYLELAVSFLESEQTCRALAGAEVHCLCISECWFDDEGATLVESLVESITERGPKGLRFETDYPFNSSERLNEFVNALRGNTYLERLDRSYLYVGDGKLEAPVDALSENQGLVHRGLQQIIVDDGCWNNLVSAISKHPTLRTLACKDICAVDESGFLERRDRINALAYILSENEQVEDIQVEEI